MSAETPALEPVKDPLEAYLKLTLRLRRFVDFLVVGKTGAEAARLAGCQAKDPKAWACKQRAKPEVRAAFEEREAQAVDEAGVRSARILLELARVAYFDKRKLYNEDGSLKKVTELDDDTAAALASIEVEDLFEGAGKERVRIGRVLKFRAWPKVDALKILAQHKKLLTEKHEVTGKDGASLPAGPTFVIAREEAQQIGHDLDEKI